MKNYINCLLIMLAAGTVTAQTTTTQNQSITAEQFVDQAALSGMKEVATGKMAKRKAQDTKVKDFGAMMAEDHGKANTELIALAKSKNIKLPKQSDIMPPSSTMDNSGNATATSNTASGNTGTTATNSNTTGNANQTTNATTGTAGTATNSNTNNSTSNTTNNSAAQQNQTTAQTDQSLNASGATNAADSLKMVTTTDVRTAIQQLDGLKDTQFDTAYTQMMVTDHKNAIALFERGTMSSDPDIKAFATKHLPTLRSHLQQIQDISGNNTPGQQPSQGTTGTGNQ